MEGKSIRSRLRSRMNKTTAAIGIALLGLVFARADELTNFGDRKPLVCIPFRKLILEGSGMDDPEKPKRRDPNAKAPPEVVAAYENLMEKKAPLAEYYAALA